MSICNPVGYDRPELLLRTINLARLEALYMYISALSRRNYDTTFGNFPS